MIENIAILIILLILSGIFSGTEIALISIGKIKARTLLKQKRRGSRSLNKLKKKPERMIITILIGNNIVNVAAAAIATVVATDYFGSAGLGIATGLMTFLILVFGEIGPKTFAASHAERIALLVAKPILYLSYILYPIIIIFEWFTKLVMKAFKSKESAITEEELKTMIEVSAEKNIIDMKEKELLEGVLEFNDIRAGEVMTPENKVFCLNENMPIKKSINYIGKSQYSRIPLYSGERITGIVHIRDIFNNLENKNKLKDIASDPVFISEKLTLDSIFKIFQLNQAHMAVVVDNKKNVVGVLTLEDLMEELVGEIMDEKDLSPNTIVRIDKHTIVVHGKTPIDKINKFFGITLPSTSKIVNISDLIKSHLEKIEKGSRLTLDNIYILIDTIEKENIIKVRIIKKKKFFQKLGDHIKSK